MAAIRRRSLALAVTTLAGCMEPWASSLPELPKSETAIWFVSNGQATSIVEADRADHTALSLAPGGEAELWLYGCDREKLSPPSPADPPLPSPSFGSCGEIGLAPCPFEAYKLSTGDGPLDPITLETTPSRRQPWPLRDKPVNDCASFSAVTRAIIPDLISPYADQRALIRIGPGKVLLVHRDADKLLGVRREFSRLQVWQVEADGRDVPRVLGSTTTAALWMGGSELGDDRAILLGGQGETATVDFDGDRIRVTPGALYPIAALRCREHCGAPLCGDQCGVQPCYDDCLEADACLTNDGLGLVERDLCIEACIVSCGDDPCFRGCLMDSARCPTQPPVFRIAGSVDDLWIASACGGLLHQGPSGDWQVVQTSTSGQLNPNGANLLWMGPGEVYVAGVSITEVLHVVPPMSTPRVEPLDGQVSTAVAAALGGRLFAAGYFPLLGASIYERVAGTWQRWFMLGVDQPVTTFHPIPGGLLAAVPSPGGLFQISERGLCPADAVPAVSSQLAATFFAQLGDLHVVVLSAVRDMSAPPEIDTFEVAKDPCGLPP